MAQAFQDLVVWQRAMEMTVAVYEATQSFPKDELYGLSSQLRRAAVSVASNIAEGRGRATQGEFKQFLGLAHGSNYEVQTQLLVAKRLKIGNQVSLERAEKLSIEVGKMLSALMAKLQLKAKS
jgi:four helix bundle protein